LIFPLSNGFFLYIYIRIKGQTFETNQKKPIIMKNLKAVLTNGNEVDVSNGQHTTLPNRAIKFNKENNRFELFNYNNNEVDYSFVDLDSLLRITKKYFDFN